MIGENYDPEKVFGKKVGYVRVFDNKKGKLVWYPAILAEQTTRSFGSTLRFSYGDEKDFRFKMNTDGTVSPYFINRRERIFDAKDYSFNNLNIIPGQYDKLQDWYMLTEEETRKLYTGLLQGVPQDFKTHDDTTILETPYARDAIKAKSFLQYMQELNYGRDSSRGEIPADKALHWEHMNNGMLQQFMDRNPEYNDRHWYGTLKDSWNENHVLIDYLDDLVKKTQHAQLLAAQHDKKFDLSKEKGGKYAYMNYYIDIGKPPATTMTDLIAQNNEIDKMERYSNLQKKYMVLKNSTRFFLKYLDDRKLTEDIMWKAVGEGGFQHGEVFNPGKTKDPRGYYYATMNLGIMWTAPEAEVNGISNSMNRSGVHGGTGKEYWSPPPVWVDSNEDLVPKWLNVSDYWHSVLVPKLNDLTKRPRSQTVMSPEEYKKLLEKGPDGPNSHNIDDPFYKNNNIYEWVPDLGKYIDKRIGIAKYFGEEKPVDKPKLEDPVETHTVIEGVGNKPKHHIVKSKPTKHPPSHKNIEHRMTPRDRLMADLVQGGYRTTKNVDGYVRNLDYEGQYVSVWDKESERIIIVRGTKPTNLYDWYQNLHIAITGRPQDLISEELSKIIAHTPDTTSVDMGGHSLGTSLAMEGIKKYPHVLDRVDKVYLFNAPYSITGGGSNRDQENNPKVRYFMNKKDIVSISRTGPLPVNYVIQPKSKNIFDILGNHTVDQWTTTPKNTPQGVTHHAHSLVRDFLQEHYGIPKHAIGAITKENYPQLSFDKSGEVTLYDDPAVHDQYKIKEHYSAVIDDQGQLSTYYKPWEVTPHLVSKTNTHMPDLQLTPDNVVPQDFHEKIRKSIQKGG